MVSPEITSDTFFFFFPRVFLPQQLWHLARFDHVGARLGKVHINQKCIVDVMAALFLEKARLKGISCAQTGSPLLQAFDA